MLALELTDLVKTYANGHRALRGVSLDVAEGDFFALLGPNGAGKSTTIGIITSLVVKTSGRVRVFGLDIDHDLEEAKALIGVVPQEINFSQFEPPLEILLNQAGFYGIPRREAAGRAESSLRQLGLWDRRRDQARTLSGGMKRRLMVARALVHRPRLLILDEPTAGVDIETRRAMWAFLRELNATGTTIILTTHYLEEAENLCRSIAIIDHGAIVENTTVRALLARLHVETFVLDLRAPVPAVPRVPGYELRLVDDRTLEADILREQDLNALFTALSAAGVEVSSMRNKANRLEELFLAMLGDGTGRGAAA